jgi:competence protein ComFB
VIQNLVEPRVQESYGSLVSRFPDFCACEACREDVLVYALNRLPPRYVTSVEGQSVSEVALGSPQDRTMIDVAVMDGIRRVAKAPRCGRGRTT